jgi:antitoxin MazE
MKTRVQKWGHSLAVRIPKSFANETGLGVDSSVDISIVDGKLVVVPADTPDLSLETLLEQVTDANVHDEIDTGPAVGREAW